MEVEMAPRAGQEDSPTCANIADFLAIILAPVGFSYWIKYLRYSAYSGKILIPLCRGLSSWLDSSVALRIAGRNSHRKDHSRA